MKKWFKFFGLGFFSNKASREAARHGYTNVFLGFMLAIVFLWSGFVGGEMLPFGFKYNKAYELKETVRLAFANTDPSKRIDVEIHDGLLRAKNIEGDFEPALLVNTVENEANRENYSVGGYDLVIDTRPADTLAEVEAYCVSNDGRELVITYEEYLTLSEVARLNFDFKLRYTGRELSLNDAQIAEYKAYAESLSEEIKLKTESLTTELSEGRKSKTDYNREIYSLYFTNYYPEITEYESSSKLPLLRNYYFHEYISTGKDKYLFIFDDYIACSFKANGNEAVSFYGFYSGMEDGAVVSDGMSEAEAMARADGFIKESYKQVFPLTAYAYGMNVFSLIPFLALMPLVVTLLAYSILKLAGTDAIMSFGSTFKIIGSFLWMSGLISALLTAVAAFLVPADRISVFPPIIFFVALAARSVVFTVREARLQRNSKHTSTESEE